MIPQRQFGNDPALAILRETLAAEQPGASRQALQAASDNIRERFLGGESVVALVQLRARVIDELLVHLWRAHANYCAGVASLVAVGGYGRGELHPCSDVDIMLLLPEELPESCEPPGTIDTAIPPTTSSPTSRAVLAGYETFR